MFQRNWSLSECEDSEEMAPWAIPWCCVYHCMAEAGSTFITFKGTCVGWDVNEHLAQAARLATSCNLSRTKMATRLVPGLFLLGPFRILVDHRQVLPCGTFTLWRRVQRIAFSRSTSFILHLRATAQVDVKILPWRKLGTCRIYHWLDGN